MDEGPSASDEAERPSDAPSGAPRDGRYTVDDLVADQRRQMLFLAVILVLAALYSLTRRPQDEGAGPAAPSPAARDGTPLPGE